VCVKERHLADDSENWKNNPLKDRMKVITREVAHELSTGAESDPEWPRCKFDWYPLEVSCRPKIINILPQDFRNLSYYISVRDGQTYRHTDAIKSITTHLARGKNALTSLSLVLVASHRVAEVSIIPCKRE